MIDLWLARLRWPLAILAALALPGILWALLRLARQIAGDPLPLWYFSMGCIGWLILWWLLLRGTRFALFLTLEHELTHALFAWATLHWVTGLRATFTRGGQMSFVGRGNFLISLAPYFFPTPCMLLLPVFAFTPLHLRMLPEVLLGVAFGWHLTSTLRETHGGQTDIQQCGKFFSLLFLPSALLFFMGVVVSFAHAEVEGLTTFLGNVIGLAVEVYRLPFKS